MKFLNLLILSLLFCACATSSNIKKTTEMSGRKIPVFMANNEQRTALKTTIEADDKAYNFLLLANKKEGYINFKIIGDFATIFASINLREHAFEYESSSPLLSNPRGKRALEEILLALFEPENPIEQAEGTANEYDNLRYNYSFKKGETVPYKLKQEGEVNKTFLFENYIGNIPQKITVKTKFNIVKINFELLAHE